MTPVVTMASLAQCPHGVPATLVTATAKVLFVGAPPLVAGDKGMVAGCPFTVPPSKPQPCATAVLTLMATKVLAEGKPVVLMNPADHCLSADQLPGGPVMWTQVQTKVLAT